MSVPNAGLLEDRTEKEGRGRVGANGGGGRSKEFYCFNTSFSFAVARYKLPHDNLIKIYGCIDI